jgi:hypothetical protein
MNNRPLLASPALNGTDCTTGLEDAGCAPTSCNARERPSEARARARRFGAQAQAGGFPAEDCTKREAVRPSASRSSLGCRPAPSTETSCAGDPPSRSKEERRKTLAQRSRTMLFRQYASSALCTSACVT